MNDALVLAADIARFVVMFTLGAAISVEVATVRFTHVAVWLPNSDVRTVPPSALWLFAASRVAALFFVAAVLHDNFGKPLHWYTPAAGMIAVCSLVASSIVARSTIPDR